MGFVNYFQRKKAIKKRMHSLLLSHIFFFCSTQCFGNKFRTSFYLCRCCCRRCWCCWCRLSSSIASSSDCVSVLMVVRLAVYAYLCVVVFVIGWPKTCNYQLCICVLLFRLGGANCVLLSGICAKLHEVCVKFFIVRHPHPLHTSSISRSYLLTLWLW